MSFNEHIKLGSPDARRIVAMLARKYLMYKQQWICQTPLKYAKYGRTLEFVLEAKSAYQQAKQLLGK